MYVETVMTRPVLTLDASRPVREAVELMRARRFRHLPVVAEGRMCGIVSDRDVTGDGGAPLSAVMHRKVIAVPPDTPVESASALMLENKIGCLPVVSAEGDLLGIVTESDLFRLLTQLLGGHEPSTRLRLRLDDLSGQLPTVTALARDHGAPITTLATEPVEAGEPRRSIILRVATIDARPFVAALRGAGVEVDAPRKAALDGAPRG